MKSFPTKVEREQQETQEFIHAYQRFAHGSRLDILEERERPDRLLRTRFGITIGVELTSVYLDDRSVPRDHLRKHQGPLAIPFDPSEIERYKKRIVKKVEDKISEAQADYETRFPLILAFYINEYVSIHFSRYDWERLISNNVSLFRQMAPFQEAVFYKLASDDALSCTLGTSGNLLTTWAGSMHRLAQAASIPRNSFYR